MADLVEDLRDQAEAASHDLDGTWAHETLEGEAAQTLEEFEAALSRIAKGAASPEAIAKAALSLSTPLAPIGDADDTVRRLLKPRS